jgi:hypothetical protein
MAVSLWLTAGNSILLRLSLSKSGGIASNLKWRQNGKAKPYRTVLRQSRHTADCLFLFTTHRLMRSAFCLLPSVLFVVRAN